MTPLPRFSTANLSAITALAILFLATPAVAQMAVGLTCPKQELVPYEPVRVTVSITNQSALPILLAPPTDTGESWVRFSVSNGQGDQLPATGKFEGTPPIQIRPGQTLEQNVDLGTAFPLTDYGTYTVQAHVYCPPDRAYSQSNTVRLSMISAREIWSKPFGVPLGLEGGGSSRIFRLLQCRGVDSIQLYVRLEDRASGMVLKCYSLGSMLELREPSMALDSGGNLHVLHLSTPTVYFHTAIDSSGKVVARQAWQEARSGRPSLAASEDGKIGIYGGRKFDPAADQMSRLAVRKLSDRPTGLDAVLGKPPPAAPAGLGPATLQDAPDLPDANYEPLTPPPGR